MRIWIAIRMTLVLTLLTGIIYPLGIAGLARVLFPAQAAGSIVMRNGRPIGAAIIGQNFAGDRYFHGRPSAAGDKGYDASNSSGSNSGPTNKAFIETVRTRVKALRESEPGLNHSAAPVELVTASGSGLDPEISRAAAMVQIARIAKVRGLSEVSLRNLVSSQLEGRWAGLIGEPRVNVLKLNLALDNLAVRPGAADEKGKAAPG
jgi:K+-transporting ATPase ATPase C chain